MLRVRPAIGRGLTAADDRPGAPLVALITHAFWESRLGSDPQVLGKTIAIDGEAHAIVGLLPASFRYHRMAPAWTTAGPVLDRFGFSTRGNHNNAYVIARLKAGVGLETARAQMQTIAQGLVAAYPATNKGIGVAVRPFRELLAGDMRRTAMMLSGAVALVLLIACVNVANLLLARSNARRRETALRAALGAPRAAVIRQLLMESLLLSGAGCLLGLFIAAGVSRGLGALMPWGFGSEALHIDFTVLAFTAAIACVTGILFGFMPALQASRIDLVQVLRQSGKGAGQAGRTLTRRALIVAEVSMAAMLLIGVGLLIESFWRLTRVDAGIRLENVTTMEVAWPYADLSAVPRMVSFYERALEKIGALPGVRAAGGVWILPLGGSSAAIPFYRADRPVPENGRFPIALYNAATAGYFQAAGVPLIRGRIFNRQDGTMRAFSSLDELRQNWAAAIYRVVISRSMAQRFWAGEDPIGKRFRFGSPVIGGPWLEIVGIVGDVRHFSLDREPEPEFYLPAFQEPRDLTFVIRAGRDGAALASAVRGVIRELDPNVPVGSVRSMEEVVASSVGSRRTNLLLLGSFAALALVLAAAGIYGVVSYSVTAKTQEYGIRMALGASRRDVLQGVLGEAGALAVTGCMIGVAAALAVSHLLSGMLYGVRPTSPATYVLVAAVLVVVSLAAGYVPARRATRVDPMTALRYE